MASQCPKLGAQHTWIWRGWHIRYTYLSPSSSAARLRPPLLLIHGFGASLEQWRHNLDYFSQQRPVYALDLLGFGGSQKPAALLGADVWQGQVFEFWQAIIRTPVILMGHSLGALVALTTTVAHPAMVQKLMLLTIPLARQELIGGLLEQLSRQVESWFASPLLLRPLFALVRQPWFIRTVLTKVYLEPDNVDDALVSGFTRPTLDRGAARTLCYLVRSRTKADFSPAVKDLLPNVSVPILLLWGTQDSVLPLGWAEQIRRLNTQLTFVEIDPGGHCLYDEAADVFHGAIQSWLEHNE